MSPRQGWRGEPRGKHRKGESWDNRGDCIACNNCVAVCPTGIDIRDGYQLECIGCGLCVDACNDVMAKVGRPPHLITVDSEYNQAAKARGAPPRLRLVRPRTILYSALLAGIAALMLAGLVTRSTTDVNVLHDRNPLFVTLSNGDIQNGYTVKILNKRREPRSYTLELAGYSDAMLRVVGPQAEEVRRAELAARGDAVASYKLYVRLPRDDVSDETMPLIFLLTDQASGETTRHETVFRGPAA